MRVGLLEPVRRAGLGEGGHSVVWPGELALDLPRFGGRVIFQLPSRLFGLDDAPFVFGLSMRALTPPAPEVLRFRRSEKKATALEARGAAYDGGAATSLSPEIDRQSVVSAMVQAASCASARRS